MNLAPLNIKSDDAKKEVTAGEDHYLEILEALHNLLKPKLYLEIGVRHGYSLRLAKNRAIAIDPDLDLKVEFDKNITLYNMTSDYFFQHKVSAITNKVRLCEQSEPQSEPFVTVDLAFIDGMHLFEFVLRDFINVEKYSKENSVVIIDDVFPNHPAQAQRIRETNVWMGDVWKIIPCLKKYRPELNLTCLNSNPSGLLVVTGLDCKSTSLQKNYTSIVQEFSGRDYHIPSESILTRLEAISPKLYLATLNQPKENNEIF